MKRQIRKGEVLFEGGSCGTGVAVLDLDRKRSRAIKPTHDDSKVDGIDITKEILQSDFPDWDENWSTLPLLIAGTRSRSKDRPDETMEPGLHIFVASESGYRTGTNQMKKRYNKQPLVDIRNDHGYVCLPLIRNDPEGREWLVPEGRKLKEYLIDSFSKIKEQQISVKCPKLYDSLRKKGEKVVRQTTYGDKSISIITECGKEIEEIEELLHMYSQDSLDSRDVWRNTSFFLKAQYGDDAMELYEWLCDSWSGSGSEEEQDRDYQWKSFPRDNNINLGYIQKIAREGDPKAYTIYDNKVKEREKLASKEKLVSLSKANEELSSLPKEELTEEQKTLLYTAIMLGNNQHKQSSLIFNLLSSKIVKSDNQWVFWDPKRLIWVKTTHDDDVAGHIGNFLDAFFIELKTKAKANDSKSYELLIEKEDRFQSRESRLSIVRDIGVKAKENDDLYYKLDTIPHLFPIKGGNVMDLRTAEVRARREDDYFTSELNITYGDPKDKTLMKYLTSIMPDKEELEYLQMLCGLFLTALPNKQLHTIIGETNSGKSSFIGIIGEVLGGNFFKSSHKELILTGPSKSRGSHDAELIPFITARLTVFSETNKGDVLDVSQIKKLVGGTKIPIRSPHSGKTEMRTITSKLVLETNNAPSYDYLEQSEYQKMAYVKFTQSFDGTKRSVVENIRKNHLNDVFAWMVQGALKVFSNNCSLPKEPPAFAVKKREIVSDMNSVTLFLSEGDIIKNKGDGATVFGSQALIDSYRVFCRSRDVKPLSAPDIKKILIGEGYSQKQLHGRWFWRGLAPPNDKEDELNVIPEVKIVPKRQKK